MGESERADEGRFGEVSLLSENIMLYVKEFGNLTKSNAIIDNAYIGKFIDDLRKEFGY